MPQKQANKHMSENKVIYVQIRLLRVILLFNLPKYDPIIIYFISEYIKTVLSAKKASEQANV